MILIPEQKQLCTFAVSL